MNQRQDASMFGATKVEMEILDLLKSGERLYGLELVKRSEGAVKKGTVYVYLTKMVEKEWVISEAEKDPSQPGLPRRRYWITGKGSRVFDRAIQMRDTYLKWDEGIAV